MIGTLFSALIAALLWFYPEKSDQAVNTSLLFATILSISALIVFTQIMVSISAWNPLARAQEKSLPTLLSTFSHDRLLKGANGFIVLFLFFTFLTLANLSWSEFLPKKGMIIAWTLLFGLSIDVLHFIFKRIQSFLDPLFALEHITNKGKEAIQAENAPKILQAFDTLAEVASKSIQRTEITLADEALDQIHQLTKVYVSAVKSLGHHLEEKKSDTIGYTLFFLLGRLGMIFQMTLEKNLEPLAASVIQLAGKVALSAASLDITLAKNPLKLMGKFGLKSQEVGMEDAAKRTLLTSLEIGRSLVQDFDITYLELKDPFLTLISTMRRLSIGMFQEDKSLPIPYLTTPFVEMKNFFNEGKAKTHQDRGVIVQAIDQVLEEFKALQEVLSTLPDLQKLKQEALKSQDEEIPS